MPAPSRHAVRRTQGFTLIEVLVALVLVSLLSLLAWRALDGMGQAGELTRQNEHNAQRIQIALAQWSADLDALAVTGAAAPLDFDGQSLRLVRYGSQPGEGVMVVAWVIRPLAQGRTWQRWVSPLTSSHGEVQRFWSEALRWSKTPLPEDLARTVSLMPVEGWQLFYYRDNAWSNPQSSVGTIANPGAGNSAVVSPSATGVGAGGGTGTVSAATQTIPDGVQLVLGLPVGTAQSAGLGGKLTRDWVAPWLGATR